MDDHEWNATYPPEEAGGYTLLDAPANVDAIGDLGRNTKQAGSTLGEPYVTSRRKFQVLLRPAKALAKARGWKATRWDYISGLYVVGGPSALVKQVRLSPLNDRIRFAITPGAVKMSGLGARLNAAVATFSRRPCAFSGGYYVTDIPIAEFFGNAATSREMSDRITNAVMQILQAVEDAP